LCWFHVNSYLFQLVPYQLLLNFLPTRTLLFTNSYFTVNQLVPYYLPTRTLLFTNSYSTIYQLVFYCLPTRTLLFTNSYSTVYQLVPSLLYPLLVPFFNQQILITNSYAIFNINCTCIFVANLMLFINKNLYQLVPSV
jgi:hypothetical protein